MYNLLKRPEIKIEHIKHFIDIPYDEDVCYQIEITCRYEGYIEKAEKEAEEKNELEDLIKETKDALEKNIIEDIKEIEYEKIPNLASEARQKLVEIRPTSLGQASRISGVNPADISILMVYLRKRENHD